MTSLILSRDGLLVARDGERLVVEDGPKEIGSFRAVDVDSLLLCGRIGLTRPAIDMLLSRRVDTHFLGRNGRYRGSLVPPVSGRNHSLAQHTVLASGESRAEFARTIVRTALRNQATLLRRWAFRRPEYPFDQLRARHADLVARVADTEDVETLRGIEGAATRNLYEGLRAALPARCRFPSRVKRPPRDPINALLSLLGSVLCGTLHGLVASSGLDVSRGVLHGASRGSPALALDVEDVYRPMCVVATTLTVLSKRVVTLDGFDIDPGGCRMQRVVVQRVLRTYASGLSRRVRARSGPRRTYLEHMHADIQGLAHAFEREDPGSWRPLEIR